MGEPATPTLADRLEALALARDIVEAVRNDERWPEPLDATFYVSEAAAMFRLAQDLAAAYDQPQPQCAIVGSRRAASGVATVGLHVLATAIDPDEARRIAAALLRAADAAEGGR